MSGVLSFDLYHSLPASSDFTLSILQDSTDLFIVKTHTSILSVFSKRWQLSIQYENRFEAFLSTSSTLETTSILCLLKWMYGQVHTHQIQMWSTELKQQVKQLAIQWEIWQYSDNNNNNHHQNKLGFALLSDTSTCDYKIILVDPLKMLDDPTVIWTHRCVLHVVMPTCAQVMKSDSYFRMIIHLDQHLHIYFVHWLRFLYTGEKIWDEHHESKQITQIQTLLSSSQISNHEVIVMPNQVMPNQVMPNQVMPNQKKKNIPKTKNKHQILVKEDLLFTPFVDDTSVPHIHTYTSTHKKYDTRQNRRLLLLT
jgi:hypothetical protein